MQTNLLKPKAIHVEPLGHHRAKVTLEPFERGFGTTIGNYSLADIISGSLSAVWYFGGSPSR